MDYQVSLIASSVRPKLYPSFFNSLKDCSVKVETVFVGNNPEYVNREDFRYITTGDIKPAQCYEIARLNASGETIVWVADDCEMRGDILGKAYRYWKSCNPKLILSLQTSETGYGNPKGSLFDMRNHCFIGNRRNTPLMAPLGMMSREFLEELGGFDSRYVCGQYENDVVMRAYQKGASVEIFGDETAFVDIDHLGKSILTGECKNELGFLKRPFATGYTHDRKVLEGSWYKGRRFNVAFKEVAQVINPQLLQRYDEFVPYEKYENLLSQSQGPKGKWE